MDSIDLGRAAKAPFADKSWVTKTLLGWLWMVLGVTAPVVYGAQIEYIRNVSQGREELPDWSDFGSKWVTGFMLLLAMMIYGLPILVLGLIMVVPGILAASAGNSDAGGGLLAGGMCLFWLIAMVYGIAIAVIFYGATVNYAMKGGFGSLFAIGEIMGHIRDGSGYFNAFLWAIVVSFGGGLVGSLLSATGIGVILMPAVSYLMVMIAAHLFGQWAARSYGVAQAAPAVAPGGYIPPTQSYAPPAPPSAPTPTYQPPAPPPAPPAAPPAAPPTTPSAPQSPPAPPAPPV